MDSKAVCSPGSTASSKSFSLGPTGGGAFATTAAPSLFSPGLSSLRGTAQALQPRDAPAASNCTVLFLGFEEGLLSLKPSSSAKLAENLPKETSSLEQIESYQQCGTPQS